MDKTDELLLKIQLLEQENQTLKKIFNSPPVSIPSEHTPRTQNKQLSFIVENASCFLLQLLPDGTIIFSNKRFSEFLKIPLSKIKGKQIFNFIRDDDVKLLNKTISSLNREKPTETIQVITAFSDTPIHVKLDLTAIFDKNKKIELINVTGVNVNEKQYLEKELHETKKRLELSFLAANDTYWDADLLTGEFFYSQNFYRMMGYDYYNVVDKFSEFLELVHPDDLVSLKECVKKNMRGEVLRSTIKFRAKTSGNDYIWILARTMIIETTESGKPIRIIGTNSDITETVRIQEKLTQSENRLKLILDNMPVMLDAMDSNKNIIHWNRECEHVTGYLKSEILNNPDSQKLLCPDKKPDQCTYNRKFNLGGNFRNHEFDVQCKDGSIKTILWSSLSDSYPVQGWHTWSVGLDITELKEVSRALELSREKLKEAQVIAKLGYWEFNHCSSICKWDSILSEIMGYNGTFLEFTVTDLYNHIHQEDRNSVIHKFIQSVKNRTQHSDIFRCITSKNETLYIKQISKTEYDKTGQPVSTRGIIFDITELKKTEIELLKEKNRAEESNRLKSAFLANMSHEIRTPLNSILGFSELLSEKTSSPEENILYIDIIKDSSKQLTSLVSDIIDISKIDANIMAIEDNRFSLNKKIAYLYEIFLNEIKSRSIPIEITAKTALNDGDDYISTDETRLTQILNNLLSNAVKFTENGSIEFGYTLTDNNRYLEFYVQDTGIGIMKKNQKKVFGRFKQADTSIGRKYGGTGLGLSISKELTRLLNGKMWLRSEYGKGSTFYFKIPYKKSDSDNSADEQILDFNSEKFIRLKNKKILIVDDNSTVLRLLSALLKKFGFDTVTADSGEKAVHEISTCRNFDLVLLDIQMPDMDGIEVLHLIHKINPAMKVIAQTANAFGEDKEKYILLGFNGHISKPFNRVEILKTITSLI